MRKYATSFILLAALTVGELHSLWANDTRVQNWILTEYRPMVMAWNVTFAGMQLTIILYFVAWLLYRSNKVNRTTVLAFFWFAIFDTIVYFYNYKIRDFGQMYYWFAAFWVISYYWKNNWLWNKLHSK